MTRTFLEELAWRGLLAVNVALWVMSLVVWLPLTVDPQVPWFGRSVALLAALLVFALAACACTLPRGAPWRLLDD